jgi:hypothetical protein
MSRCIYAPRVRTPVAVWRTENPEHWIFRPLDFFYVYPLPRFVFGMSTKCATNTTINCVMNFALILLLSDLDNVWNLFGQFFRQP